MIFSVRVTNYRRLPMLHMCDAKLLGMNLTQDDLQINISRNCYGQKLVDKKEARTLLRESSVINIAGKDSVQLSVEMGIGSANGVRTIDGVPFLIIFKM